MKALKQDWMLLAILAFVGVYGTVRIVNAEHPGIEAAAQMAWLSFDITLYWAVRRWL